MDIEVTASDGMVRLNVGEPVLLTPIEAHALTTRLVAVLADLAEPPSGPAPSSPSPARRGHLVLVASSGSAVSA